MRLPPRRRRLPASLPAPSDVAVQPSPDASPTASQPVPEPTPVLVPAPLTGVLVSPEAAAQHPIAVMIDDQSDARPQSGFNAASVVWHAPAEGGIPRYMLIFQDQIPTGRRAGPQRAPVLHRVGRRVEGDVRPRRRLAPGDRDARPRRASGEWVYNADEFRWGAPLPGGVDSATGSLRAAQRVHRRQAPPAAREAARRGRRADGAGLDVRAGQGARAPAGRRPDPGRPTRTRRSRTATTRRRTATSATSTAATEAPGGPRRRRGRRAEERRDPADGVRRAQRRPPDQGRLEAQNIGQGEAWISTGGVTVKGEWRKKSATAPTRLFGPDGEPITLTAGQTFVQVIPTVATRSRSGTAPPASARDRPRAGLLLGLLGAGLAPRSRSADADLRVDPPRLERDIRPGPARLRTLPRRLDKPATDALVGPRRANGLGQSCRIARLDEDPGAANGLWERADGRRDNWHARRRSRRAPGGPTRP